MQYEYDRRQTVPRRRTGDAECSIPETSSGTRDDQVPRAAERRAERVETVDTGTRKSCM